MGCYRHRANSTSALQQSDSISTAPGTRGHGDGHGSSTAAKPGHSPPQPHFICDGTVCFPSAQTGGGSWHSTEMYWPSMVALKCKFHQHKKLFKITTDKVIQIIIKYYILEIKTKYKNWNKIKRETLPKTKVISRNQKEMLKQSNTTGNQQM